jgi:hypothetical protein
MDQDRASGVNFGPAAKLSDRDGEVDARVGRNSPIWKQVREIVDEKDVLHRFKVGIV